jgi:hypothetical protein
MGSSGLKSSGSGQEKLAGICEHGDGFLEYRRNYWLLNKDSESMDFIIITNN